MRRQHPQNKRDNPFIPREGNEPFPNESVFGIFDVCDLDDRQMMSKSNYQPHKKDPSNFFTHQKWSI